MTVFHVLNPPLFKKLKWDTVSGECFCVCIFEPHIWLEIEGHLLSCSVCFWCDFWINSVYLSPENKNVHLVWSDPCTGSSEKQKSKTELLAHESTQLTWSYDWRKWRRILRRSQRTCIGFPEREIWRYHDTDLHVSDCRFHEECSYDGLELATEKPYGMACLQYLPSCNFVFSKNTVSIQRKNINEASKSQSVFRRVETYTKGVRTPVAKCPAPQTKRRCTATRSFATQFGRHNALLQHSIRLKFEVKRN